MSLPDSHQQPKLFDSHSPFSLDRERERESRERKMELTAMTQATQLHAHLIKTTNTTSTSSLALGKLLTFSALSPAGNLAYARTIFDSLLPNSPNYSSYCTNTMLRAYSKSPHPEQALLFTSLTPPPDHFTFPFLLNACTRLHSPRHGRQLHALAHKHALTTDPFISNSLIHMYASCGELKAAIDVLNRMMLSDRDVVSWTSIIHGAAASGHTAQALKLFEKMLAEGATPNEATVVSVLRACADSGALSVGRRVHRHARRYRFHVKTNVATALMDMYAKCGCIDDAEDLFNKMTDRDVFALTVMISGLASHGRCKDALDLFGRMQGMGVRPDERTMTAVLCACRNAGWVSEGQRYFDEMKNFGVKPKLQHYGCMVDLLAQAGEFDEAEEFIKGMALDPDAVLWRTLVWACKTHGDTDRAERLMNERQLLGVDSGDSGNYVLLGNVYASAGKWEKKARVRDLMVQRRIEKPPGCSKIEVDGVIHAFQAGDSEHPKADKIYAKWDEVAGRLRLEGYCPKTLEVLLDAEEEQKAFQLHHHSEKLAVAFGLISTSPGDRILVVKNLRSCEDCHNVMKFVSRIYNRKITIRDRIRFHHFSNGTCSCGDHW